MFNYWYDFTITGIKAKGVGLLVAEGEAKVTDVGIGVAARRQGNLEDQAVTRCKATG